MKHLLNKLQKIQERDVNRRLQDDVLKGAGDTGIKSNDLCSRQKSPVSLSARSPSHCCQWNQKIPSENYFSMFLIVPHLWHYDSPLDGIMLQQKDHDPIMLWWSQYVLLLFLFKNVVLQPQPLLHTYAGILWLLHCVKSSSSFPLCTSLPYFQATLCIKWSGALWAPWLHQDLA